MLSVLLPSLCDIGSHAYKASNVDLGNPAFLASLSRVFAVGTYYTLLKLANF